MQSEQESAQPAAGRPARKNGHRIYDDHERVDLDAELLAARPFRLTIFPTDERYASGSCTCRRNQQ
jgi:hypothetical protein